MGGDSRSRRVRPCAAELVRVPVVEVGVVRMRMHHRLVPMPVRVGLTEWGSTFVLV